MITIEEIRLQLFQAAKTVIESVNLELWGLTLDEVRQYDDFADLDDVQAYCPNTGGTS
jgi:hypothetical protein